MESVMKDSVLPVVAEVELVYKTKVKPSSRPQITASLDAYRILMNSWDQNLIELREQFKILLLNRANKVLGIYQASSGGVSSTIADVKLIILAALKSNAAKIILTHNHPAGSLKPSTEDINLTRKITNAGKLLDIQVLDHLIVTTEGYYSFQDQGML